MNLLPLKPGVRRSPDTGKGASKSSKPPAKAQIDKVLKQDDYTCRFCGFRSEHYQRVIEHDEDGKSQLVTCCTFCEQCLHLDRAGMMGSGILIWMPEIGQVELNHLARAVYVGRAAADEGSEEVATLATRAYDALMARRADAKKRLGSDDPLLLATILHESLSDEETKKAMAKLDGLRLMPLDKHIMRGPKGDVNQFPQLVKYWQSPQGPYGQKTPDKWLDMFKTANAGVGNA